MLWPRRTKFRGRGFGFRKPPTPMLPSGAAKKSSRSDAPASPAVCVPRVPAILQPNQASAFRTPSLQRSDNLQHPGDRCVINIQRRNVNHIRKSSSAIRIIACQRRSCLPPGYGTARASPEHGARFRQINHIDSSRAVKNRSPFWRALLPICDTFRGDAAILIFSPRPSAHKPAFVAPGRGNQTLPADRQAPAAAKATVRLAQRKLSLLHSPRSSPFDARRHK